MIIRAMGFRPTAEELAELIEEIDEDGSGAIEFPEFAQLCAKFLVEDPDPETMRAELKQAFRLFDKQGTVRFARPSRQKWRVLLATFSVNNGQMTLDMPSLEFFK